MAVPTSPHLQLAPRGPQGLWAALAEASEPAYDDDATCELAHLRYLQRLLAVIDGEAPDAEDAGEVELAEVVPLERYRSRRR